MRTVWHRGELAEKEGEPISGAGELVCSSSAHCPQQDFASALLRRSQSDSPGKNSVLGGVVDHRGGVGG